MGGAPLGIGDTHTLVHYRNAKPGELDHHLAIESHAHVPEASSRHPKGRLDRIDAKATQHIPDIGVEARNACEHIGDLPALSPRRGNACVIHRISQNQKSLIGLGEGEETGYGGDVMLPVRIHLQHILQSHLMGNLKS